jgi:hypothetical protein
MSEQNLGDLNVKVSRWLTAGLAVAVVAMPTLLLWKGSQPRGKEPVPPPRPKAVATRPAPDLGFTKISPDEQVIFLDAVPLPAAKPSGKPQK